MSADMLDLSGFTLTAMYLPGAKGEIATPEEMNKINSILSIALDYLQAFVEGNDNGTLRSQLILSSVQLDEEAEVDPELDPGAKFIIYVENFEGNNLNASALKNTAEIRISTSMLEGLPEATDDPDDYMFYKFTEDEKAIHNLLTNHFLHEIMHMLGAYHSSTGIMSGAVPLMDALFLTLDESVDHITARIISEYLVSGVPRTQPDILCSYQDRKLEVFGNFPIHTIVFLNKTEYTDHYFFVSSSNEFKTLVPVELEWDAVVVQLVYGTLAYFAKNHLSEQMQPPLRFRARVPVGEPLEEFLDLRLS